MKKMLIILFPFLFLLSVYSAPPIPYSGKIAILGVNYSGEARFAFSLHDGKGTFHWRNGMKAGETIKVSVHNGRYNVLLGGQGMNPLPPELFLFYDQLYLRVEFDNKESEGLQHLYPDQLITATPRALVAEMAKFAKTAEIAQTANSIKAGAVTKSMLGSDILSELNKPITRDMLPTSVLTDLNRTVTKSMLGSDLLADLNRSITSPMIQSSSITSTQLNEQILKYLRPELTEYPQDPGLVFNGQNIIFNSNAQGKYLNYQWFKNDQSITGATTRILQLSDLNGSLHDGNYSLTVSNDFGSVVTSSIQVEVNSTRTFHLVPSTANLPMVLIKGNTFTMGQVGVATPEHNVTLIHDFFIGQYEVTQNQYRTVMLGNNRALNATPSTGVYRGNQPVVNVSWNDVQIFLSRLNTMEQEHGRLGNGWKYTLPTEAEWEYACRAGSSTSYAWGNDINSSKANYDAGSDLIEDVGQYPPNNWGLHDMHGNITEHVADWIGSYPSAAVTNPEGPAFGRYRVKRGGSFTFPAEGIRSATRLFDTPDKRFNNLGFRLAYKFIQPDVYDPTIILSGGSNMSHSYFVNWADPGYQAHDARDGEITSSVLVTGTVDVNSTGIYILFYNITDAAGNEANATRTINVGMASTHTADLNSTVHLEMLWVQPGTFTMGSPTTETGRQSDREEEHNVSLTKGFYLGKYEVTQSQYEAVMIGNTNSISPTPSQWPNNPNRPVEKISWFEIQIFLTRLNAQQSGNFPAGWSYVLPTESQWEYACRAGTNTMYSWGNGINATLTNYPLSGLGQTRDVGQYLANPWGFFDMHGNVWEWTADWYQAAYPTGNPVVNPSGPASGSERVLRGGAWGVVGTSLRSAARISNNPVVRGNGRGFRVALQQQ